MTVSLRRSMNPSGNAIRSALLQHLRDEERQLQGLRGVQPRVAGGLVAAGEVGLADGLGAAQALGDVFAGQLDVQAAGPDAEAAADVEEALHLGHDVVEPAGLDPARA